MILILILLIFPDTVKTWHNVKTANVWNKTFKKLAQIYACLLLNVDH